LFQANFGCLFNFQRGDYIVKSKVFILVKIQVSVFWVMTLYSDVVGYQCFGGPCCLCLQEDWGCMVSEPTQEWNLEFTLLHY